MIGRLQETIDGPQWGLFVDIYSPLIYRYCRRRGVQDADARDITQNVFIAVQQGIGRFKYDPTRGMFRSWLGTITSHEICRFQHKSKRAGIPSVVATDGSGQLAESDASWIIEFNSHLCDTAFGRIQGEFEEVTWQAFELLWKHDKKSAEVAAILNKTTAWVYQAKCRVMRRLEKEVHFLAADVPSFVKDQT